MTQENFLKQIVLSDMSAEMREYALAQLLHISTIPASGWNDAVGILIPPSGYNNNKGATKYITRTAYTEISALLPALKIEAIKRLRDAVGHCSTGWILTLLDAKNAVEQWNFKL
jgi:hypothetical protein